MRSLSGVKPTGTLHIGNYFGAIRQFVELQEKYDCFYFIADYHALNAHPEPATLAAHTWDIVTAYMALGIDPTRSTIFLQSQVPEVAELTLLLFNHMPMGLLQRAHAYKDALAKDQQPNCGLFVYPALMAADILLYDSNVVPVGQDQKQHLEITRDVAMTFNHVFNDELFVVPDPLILESVAVVPGTDGRKMSKSYGNVIDMFAPEKALKKQVMNIVTDSTPLEEPKNPDTCNVFQLYKLVATADELAEMRQNYLAGNYGFGHAKLALFEKLLAHFAPLREKRAWLVENRDVVERALTAGAARARETAMAKMKRLKKAMGLVGGIY